MPKSDDSALNAPLSSLSRDVLELYATALADVRFPDLDLTTLRSLAAEVADAQQEVDRLESELRDAKERVGEHNAALDARAERALAYARIYAEGHPELKAQIAEIRPQASAERTAPLAKKRTKARKSGDDGQLEVPELAAE
jgi:chromosome segregation ATPase